MKIKYINLALIEFFLPACWCLMFSVRSCRCRGMKPIRDCRNWRKVRIIYSFPLWWRRIWHASQNRYRHWEPYGLHNISGVWTKIRNKVVYGWGQLNSNVALGLSDEINSFHFQPPVISSKKWMSWRCSSRLSAPAGRVLRLWLSKYVRFSFFFFLSL